MKKPEEYGQIFYNVTGADSIAFVELLDAQDKVVRTVPVVDGKADFYFLNPGKYSARLIMIRMETVCGTPENTKTNGNRRKCITILR